jgi:hypothetical protein
MTNAAPEVTEFLRDLSHPLKEGVVTVRDTIFASDPARSCSSTATEST